MPGSAGTCRTLSWGAVAADTRVVVGHSLGSVVAYEALCAHPEWPVRTLVTLGSPLGLRLVFDRLRPPPTPGPEPGVPRGAWPGPVTAWTNLADSGDVVAVVEDLRPLFGPGVRQVRVHTGASAHDLRPYLTERLTGAAIAAGMRG
jgi:pimeloyl-ACP methyl ester carboxylesterase